MELLHKNKVDAKIDMECDLRGFSKNTKRLYQYNLRNFLSFIKKDPRTITTTDAKRYILHLKEQRKSHKTINGAIAAIKFLYRDIWKRHSFSAIKSLKEGHHMPTVISRADILKMIKATSFTKHRLFIELLYSSGLRVGEAVKIKTKDIRIDDRLVYVKQGKGAKDRIVILSDQFIETYVHYLTERYYNGIQSEYVFDKDEHHITIRTAQEIVKKAAAKAGIDYNVYPHAFRASFATHLFEKGERDTDIQKLMGHSRIDTTQGYIGYTTKNLQKVKSPLDTVKQ